MLPIVKKNKSFIVSIAITFVVGYTISNLVYFLYSNLKYYGDFTETAGRLVAKEITVGVTFMKHGELKALHYVLEDARKAKEIGFYMIKEKGKVLYYNNGDGRLEDLDTNYELNSIVANNSVIYGTAVVGDSFLVVGLKKNRTAYLSSIFKEMRTDFVVDIFLIGLMVVGIVVFFFRDIRKLIQIIKSRDRKGLESLSPNTTVEAMIIAQGMKAYEQSFVSSKLDQQRLRGQVTKAVRTELDSGLTPPYQFRCVMVRTDINNYSSIYSAYPIEDFMSVINDFFSRASEVVDRYGGFTTDYIGDEIIFYFKAEDHKDAALMALAAVRDIQAIADEINRMTIEVRGYPFRVKSAVASGSLRFGPQVKGFALSGGVFVETVRILSHVDDKDQNQVYMPARLASRATSICKSESKKSAVLRGIPGVSELFVVTQFRTCESVLNDLTADSLQVLGYFRSDKDLTRILKVIEGLATQGSDYKLLCKVIQSLKGLSGPSSSIEVHDAFLSLIRGLVESRNSSNLDLMFAISAVVSLSIGLLSIPLYSEELRTYLMKFLDSSDRRIISNALDALTHFEPRRRDELLTRLSEHPDNRVRANAFIKQGLVALDNQVIQGLKQMLQSSDALFMASGCYAVGELARYYRNEDLPFYETHLQLQSLLRKVWELADHKNDMVRRQAESALTKCRYVRATQGSTQSSKKAA